MSRGEGEFLLSRIRVEVDFVRDADYRDLLLAGFAALLVPATGVL